jgi:protein TonB
MMNKFSRAITTPCLAAACGVLASAAAQAAPTCATSSAAAYKTTMLPEYPRGALLQGLEGRVVFDVDVDARGDVDKIVLRSRAAHPALVSAAKSSVRRWSFRPALQCGVPIASRVTVPVRFVLSDVETAPAFVDCKSC